MSFIRRHSRLVLIAMSCAVLGAGASAIATAAAATGATGATGSAQASAHPGLRVGSLRRLARRSVQGDFVVNTKQGFVTVTFERGTVQSVSGQQLTIAEGTRQATYKTVTLTIPADAVVRDNHQKTVLSTLAPGQRVIVVQAPQHTYVIAHAPRTA